MKKVLIANRGEIACRIIRACRQLDIHTVAVYSDADKYSMHATLADEAWHIGSSRPSESYLVGSKILAVAKKANANAIHPGYGFLAENHEFAEQVRKAGVIWIGPNPRTIADMGDKDRARELARQAGIPVLAGSRRFSIGKLDSLERAADEIGYPVLIKPAAGGGGLGMQVMTSPRELKQGVNSAQALAERIYGDGSVFLERYVERARHIEVQVLGLNDGRVVQLFDRECSIQRRFQKIIEEAPAPKLPATMRSALADGAVKLAERERYLGAGTVEFIVDVDRQDYYFLEMNTRIQVEHPVTEEISGLDLVALQIQVAFEVDMSWLVQDQLHSLGSALECRIYAEDPNKAFRPSPGTLRTLELPVNQDGVRVECGLRTGDEITQHYDPMIAKIIAHGNNRDQAIERLSQALSQTKIEGIFTNLDLLRACIVHPAFREGAVQTTFLQKYNLELLGA